MEASPIGSPMLKLARPAHPRSARRGVVRPRAHAQGHPPRPPSRRRVDTASHGRRRRQILTKAEQLGYTHRDIAAVHEFLARLSEDAAPVTT